MWAVAAIVEEHSDAVWDDRPETDQGVVESVRVGASQFDEEPQEIGRFLAI